MALMNKQQTEGTYCLHHKFYVKFYVIPDLKAFENRLIECVTHVSRKTRIWKGKSIFSFVALLRNELYLAILICAAISTFTSLWAWIQDGSSYVRPRGDTSHVHQ